MEYDATLDFPHRLMDVTIKNRDRTETSQIIQRLRAVIRAPTPVGINLPERNVGEHDDGCFRRAAPQIIFEPFQLFAAERAEPVLLNVHDVHESNEVHPAMIEAVPAVAF